ncbi:MAG: hypothetical protein WCO98_13010 [bacterium]
MRIFLAIFHICLGLSAVAQQPVDPYTLDALMKRIPPLTYNSQGRLPLITWEPFITSAKDISFSKFVPLSEDNYKTLNQRGLAQAIPMRAEYIPIAAAMQKAGMPVVLMEGNGGDVPGSLAPDSLHKLPKDFKFKDSLHPCPLLLAGWHLQAMKTRGVLQQFKDAGINIAAAWLDWENEPWWTQNEWEQSRNCERCKELFPPGILDSYPSYRDFIVRFRQQLYSAYLAAPIREFYPQCVITNWAVVHSSPELLTLHYWGRFRFPSMNAGLFNATNPVAYGNDIEYSLLWDKVWKKPKETPLNQENMDKLYTYVMLSQISEDAANAQEMAPETLCVPWVCRYCPDMEDPKVPILSRVRYREILRHIWLRGADSLQIFNAYRPKYLEIRAEEVEDAVASYNEVLPYRNLLDKGTIMNTSVPGVEEAGAIWSGMRTNDEAVIRAFSSGTKTVTLYISVWKNTKKIHLKAPPEGATYHVKINGKKIIVVKAN